MRELPHWLVERAHAIAAFYGVDMDAIRSNLRHPAIVRVREVICVLGRVPYPGFAPPSYPELAALIRGRAITHASAITAYDRAIRNPARMLDVAITAQHLGMAVPPAALPYLEAHKRGECQPEPIVRPVTPKRRQVHREPDEAIRKGADDWKEAHDAPTLAKQWGLMPWAVITDELNRRGERISRETVRLLGERAEEKLRRALIEFAPEDVQREVLGLSEGTAA